MTQPLVRRLESIPGVHVRQHEGAVVVEPVTEHDLVQALIALRQSESPVSLSLSRMTKIGPFNDSSLTVACDAGVELEALERVANSKDLTLGALSPGAMKLTVGEFLEGPYAGLRAIPGGRLEPLSVALHVVTPDALLTMSHVSPRSAAGPELDALHLGGARQFGIITHAVLRLAAKQFTSQRASFSFAAPGALIRALIATLQDGVSLSHAAIEKRADRYVVTVLIHGSAETIERDLSTLGHRATDAQGRGAAAGKATLSGDVTERVLDWREVRAALEANETLEIWRLSADGAIASGTRFGHALVRERQWQHLPALAEVARAVDTFGIMRILS